MEEIIGYIAMMLTTVANLPQFYKSVKTQSVGDISIWYIVPLAAGICCWLIYGIMINSIPLMVSNSIGAFTMGWISIIKLKEK